MRIQVATTASTAFNVAVTRTTHHGSPRLNYAAHVYRRGAQTWVSFPTLARAFKALHKLTEVGRPAEYDGNTGGRFWVLFYCTL